MKIADFIETDKWIFEVVSKGWLEIKFPGKNVEPVTSLRWNDWLAAGAATIAIAAGVISFIRWLKRRVTKKQGRNRGRRNETNIFNLDNDCASNNIKSRMPRPDQ